MCAGPKSRCLLVVLEGLDGVGKTTTATRLQRELRKLCIPVTVRHFERTYLRAAFRIARRRTDPRLKYLLQTASLILLAEEIARTPSDTVFVCDRYVFSAQAYYLAVTDGRDLIVGIDRFLPKPDVPILLECPAVTRRQRLLRGRTRPSARKLKTTDERLSNKIHSWLLRTLPWNRINNEKLSQSETTSLVLELVLRSYGDGH
jgi:thymidylate kinase